MHIPVCIPPTAVIMNMMQDHSQHSNSAHLKRMQELDDEIARLKYENATREHELQSKASSATMEYFRHEIRGNALKCRTLLECMYCRPKQIN
jgi:hypothetical protein